MMKILLKLSGGGAPFVAVSSLISSADFSAWYFVFDSEIKIGNFIFFLFKHIFATNLSTSKAVLEPRVLPILLIIRDHYTSMHQILGLTWLDYIENHHN